MIYPYVVEGGFTVVSQSPDTGLYDAHFGMILTDQPRGLPRGLRVAPTAGRPQDGSNRPMNTGAHCAEPPTAVQRPRCAERPAAGRLPVRLVATYDSDLGRLRWGDDVPRDLSSPGSLAPRTLGEDSWKWLFLQPLMTSRE